MRCVINVINKSCHRYDKKNKNNDNRAQQNGIKQQLLFVKMKNSKNK